MEYYLGQSNFILIIGILIIVGNKDADEIVLIDVSKDKSNRNLFYKAIQRITKSCFMPIVVGGHIDTFDEISKLQDLGQTEF